MKIVFLSMPFLFAGCAVPPTEPPASPPVIAAPCKTERPDVKRVAKPAKPPTPITPPCPAKENGAKTDQELILEKLDCLLNRK